MKKYLVFSDLHGNYATILKKIKKLINGIDGVIFAGDGVSYVLENESLFPSVYLVKGNCDFCPGIKSELLFKSEDVGIFLTHGHNYGVKSGLLRLFLKASSLDAGVAVFGHTHEPYIDRRDGVLLLNPGSCSSCFGTPTIAFLTVDGKNADAKILRLS